MLHTLSDAPPWPLVERMRAACLNWQATKLFFVKFSLLLYRMIFIAGDEMTSEYSTDET